MTNMDLKAPIAELVGTFVFVTIILKYAGTSNGPFYIGAALTLMILFSNEFSDGHFNPAVTIADLTNLNKNPKPNYAKAGMYIGAQIAGAALAVAVLNMKQ